MPEIIEAFACDDADFEKKYGFEKPDKTASLVVGCFAGKRAAAAGEQLVSLGFNNIKYLIMPYALNNLKMNYQCKISRVYPGSFGDWKANGGPILKE